MSRVRLNRWPRFAALKRALTSGIATKPMMATVASAFALACSSDPLSRLAPGDAPAVSDSALFALASADGVWTYYKRSAVPIVRQSSAHPERSALVRYNAVAATQLDASGKVRSGAEFPDSSLIVKALSNGNGVATYAVMLKLRRSVSAGRGGWVWAEFGPDGAVRYASASRGAGCTGCHDTGIDYTRMNDTHP